ncbi:MAG: MerR family transcriptional regulator [Firmicutes bacterium]|nr:MerR family transcriptional regulator [Bacillota bacterium]
MARVTGLSLRQVRYYEKKGPVVPRRTQGNRRQYSRGDIERLLSIRRLLAEGLSLGSRRT